MSVFLDAPLWAQAAMVAFAALAAWFAYGALVTPKKHERTVAALAAARQATLTPEGAGFASFSTLVEGRAFDVEHTHWSSAGGAPGGPGQVLVCRTQLAGAGWDVHPLTVRCTDSPVSGFGRQAATVTTGDAAFDARFLVREDALPLPPGWLTPQRRAAIAAIYDAAPRARALVVDGGALLHVMSGPWHDITPSEFDVLLRRQAALAATFDQLL